MHPTSIMAEAQHVRAKDFASNKVLIQADM